MVKEAEENAVEDNSRCDLAEAKYQGDAFVFHFFFSSRRRHTRCLSDWSSDVCSSDLADGVAVQLRRVGRHLQRLGRHVHRGEAHQLQVVQVALTAAQVAPTQQRALAKGRSEERRVGKECRSRRSTEKDEN